MNLSFDLQLFVSVASGLSYSDKTFNVANVEVDTAFGTGGKYSFNANPTVTGGLEKDTVSSGIVTFSGGSSAQIATGISVVDTGNYKWNINSSNITKLNLGAKANVSLNQLGGKTDVTLAATGGQSVTFGSGAAVSLDLKSAAGASTGALTFKNESGNVEFLTGSTLSGATVSGASSGAISIESGANATTFNLEGKDSEAVITVTGTGKVTSDSVIGFKKITYSAAKGSDVMTLDVDNVKNSTVLIAGGTGADVVNIKENVAKTSEITVTGGDGNDAVTLSGVGVELVGMGSGAGNGDTVEKWVESKGLTDYGNVLSIKGSMDKFFVANVGNGMATIGLGDTRGAATVDTAATTVKAATNGGYTQFGINVQTDDSLYSALLVGNTGLVSTAGTNFDNYNYIIADNNKTLDLGNTKKKTVVLANSIDEKHWGDENIYKDVTTITSSSAGGSLIINGVDSIQAKITANGKNDSIWGGNNTLADTIDLSKGKENVNVFSGANDGLDVVEQYAFSSTLAKSSVIRFLDGVEYVTAGSGTLTIGKDDSNAAVIKFKTADPTGGNKLAYAFGTEGEKYVAGVDTSANGKGSISYDSLASVYIGQGDSSISVGSAAKDVKLGWDGGAGYIGIGAIDASSAADGAVVVGTTDNEQTIKGSSRGASSISGGFVADEWTDKNNDVLIGGDVATKSTTFFVGKDMGKDEIQKLSSQDNIVFLGTKYSELNNFKYDASDNGFIFKFSDSTITADASTGKKLSNLKDVSLYFDDGTYVWDGKELTLKE